MLKKILSFGIIGAAFLMFGGARVAKADDIEYLQFTNGFVPNLSGTNAYVTVDPSGSTVTVTAAAGYGIDRFGFNGVTGVNITTCSGVGSIACSFADTPTSGQYGFDGFGKFGDEITGGNGSSTYITTLVFTVTGGSLGDADGSSADFAAHVVFPAISACTGYVGDVSQGTGDQSPCTPTSTPEPGTFSLLGVGLLGLVGLGMFRRNVARS
jgi:MYXO-CTERM domain-containing protein